jgi:hypothetical protein
MPVVVGIGMRMGIDHGSASATCIQGSPGSLVQDQIGISPLSEGPESPVVVIWRRMKVDRAPVIAARVQGIPSSLVQDEIVISNANKPPKDPVIIWIRRWVRICEDSTIATSIQGFAGSLVDY